MRYTVFEHLELEEGQTTLLQLLTDAENQPHQFISRFDLLAREITKWWGNKALAAPGGEQ